jgi:hypothetical protein
VHAPGSGGVVRVERLAARYWKDRLRGIRRVGVSSHVSDASFDETTAPQAPQPNRRA